VEQHAIHAEGHAIPIVENRAASGGRLTLVLRSKLER
jgi:hypothetical protein